MIVGNVVLLLFEKPVEDIDVHKLGGYTRGWFADIYIYIYTLQRSPASIYVQNTSPPRTPTMLGR